MSKTYKKGDVVFEHFFYYFFYSSLVKIKKKNIYFLDMSRMCGVRVLPFLCIIIIIITIIISVLGLCRHGG